MLFALSHSLLIAELAHSSLFLVCLSTALLHSSLPRKCGTLSQLCVINSRWIFIGPRARDLSNHKRFSTDPKSPLPRLLAAGIWLEPFSKTSVIETQPHFQRKKGQPHLQKELFEAQLRICHLRVPTRAKKGLDLSAGSVRGKPSAKGDAPITHPRTLWACWQRIYRALGTLVTVSRSRIQTTEPRRCFNNSDVDDGRQFATGPQYCFGTQL